MCVHAVFLSKMLTSSTGLGISLPLPTGARKKRKGAFTLVSSDEESDDQEAGDGAHPMTQPAPSTGSKLKVRKKSSSQPTVSKKAR